MWYLTRSLTVLFTVSVHAWNVVYYSEPGCRGGVVGHSNLPNDELDTCHLPAEDIVGSSEVLPVVRSARFSGLFEDDGGSLKRQCGTSYAVRVYHNTQCFTNCTHRNVIGHLAMWDNCASWPVEPAWFVEPVGDLSGRKPVPVNEISLNVVVTGNNGESTNVDGSIRGSVLSDGICLLSHGDHMEILGRKYRMQQVAANWFREIAIEEWDDNVHRRNKTPRFVQHGDVDVFGRLKMWRISTWDIRSVLIEQWDEQVHVSRKVTAEAEDSLFGTLDNVCRAIEDGDVTQKEIDAFDKRFSLDIAHFCEGRRDSRHRFASPQRVFNFQSWPMAT